MASCAGEREMLPIPDGAYAEPNVCDEHDPPAVLPPIEEIRPPRRASNVLVVPIDDVGFGASSAFGGPVSTPVATKLARTGLKDNSFHMELLA